MLVKGRLYLEDNKPEIELVDGTLIESDKIGYLVVAHNGYGISYDRMTQDDYYFIVKNDLEIEVEMMDEFSDPEEYQNIPLFEGGREPKLYKGRVIIHLT
jgi:hypothetical protein